MNVQVKSSQVKSFDRLPYGCLLFMYRLDLNVNAHRRCTTIRLVSYGTVTGSQP